MDDDGKQMAVVLHEYVCWHVLWVGSTLFETKENMYMLVGQH
jgi:hypothetical protein